MVSLGEPPILPPEGLGMRFHLCRAFFHLAARVRQARLHGCVVAPFSVIALLAGTALAAPQGWHRTKKDGEAAALKSGKPVLVVTIWKEKV